MTTANYQRTLETAKKLLQLNEKLSNGRSKEEREIARLNWSAITAVIARLEEQAPWNVGYQFPKEGR